MKLLIFVLQAGLFLVSPFFSANLQAADAPGGVPPDEQLTRWMMPIWKGGAMYEESLLMWAGDGQQPAAPLLFEAEKILSVQDAPLQRTFLPEQDWTYVDHQFVLPPVSRIACATASEMFPLQAGPPRTTMPMIGGGFLMFHEGPFIHKKQIVVTYQHEPGAWAGPVPAFDPAALPKTLAKLKAKQPLKIIAYGDSITVGASASSSMESPPLMPRWVDLVALWLRHVYQAPVTLVNKGVGGTTSAWGVQHAADTFKDEQADLAIVAFGMNERARPPAKFAENIQGIMAEARAANPDVEFILVQSMEPNQKWSPLGNLSAFGDELRSLRGTGVAMADMQAMHAALLKRKRYEDMTGNNVNHPNDFLVRVYAQVVSAALAEPGAGSQP